MQPSSTQLTLDNVPDNLDGAATHVQDLVNPLANLIRKERMGWGRNHQGTVSSSPHPKQRTRGLRRALCSICAGGQPGRRQESSYLGDVGVADLGHDVADVLENEESCIQAPQVELILHVIVYDLPSSHYVLTTDKHGINAGQRLDRQRTASSLGTRQSPHSRESLGPTGPSPSVLKHLSGIPHSAWTMEATEGKLQDYFPF